MKKTILFFLLSILTVGVFAQADPVKWSFAAVKKGNNVYQVIATASVSSPWHIYSQTTPEGGPVPTKFTYAKNPLVTLQGRTAEKGQLKVVHDKNFGVNVKYFASGKVSFTQTVKARAKTNLSGSVEYMVCNDHECLPPHSKTFTVQLH